MARKISTEIKIGQESNFLLQQLSIHQPINAHHTFELHCDLNEKSNHLIEVAEKTVGEQINIKFKGEGLQSKRENFFSGIVTDIGLSKNLGGHNTLLFRGYGHTISLDDGPHLQSYLDKSLADIVKDVANNYGLEIKVQGTNHTNPLPFEVQYRESGYNFLNRLADTYGEWFFFDGTDLHFGKAPTEKAIPLNFGVDLHAFDLVLRARPSKFKTLAYDPVNHDFPESQASQVSVDGLDDYGKLMADRSDRIFAHQPVNLLPHAIKDKADVDNFTGYRKSAAAADYVVFAGSSDRHDLKTGSIIEVKGKRLGIGKHEESNYGSFRILSIKHSIDGTGDYRNHFQAAAANLVRPPVTRAYRVPMAEPQPAEVLDNHDPKKLGRVKVQFQWQKENGDETPWLRVAASGAGGSHGAYFVPEKGDQTMIAFENNNPNTPYVLGSLYHGQASPGDSADPDNNVKVIKTRSGNHIYLSDESGKEQIKIENGTNVIVLSLDGSGSISISTAGDMTLSGKNISIYAEEKLSLGCKNLDANGKQTVKITTDKLTAEAQSNVEITAQQNAKVAGTVKTSVGEGGQMSELKGTTVTVESTATTEVKGPMVKLN